MIRSIGHSSRLKDSSYLKKKEHALNELQNRIQCFQENAQLQLKDMQKEVDTDIRKIIINNLNRFSFHNDVICVLGKETILYCPTCIDLTKEFIAYYKKESWKR